MTTLSSSEASAFSAIQQLWNASYAEIAHNLGTPDFLCDSLEHVVTVVSRHNNLAKWQQACAAAGLPDILSTCVQARIDQNATQEQAKKAKELAEKQAREAAKPSYPNPHGLPDFMAEWQVSDPEAYAHAVATKIEMDADRERARQERLDAINNPKPVEPPPSQPAGRYIPSFLRDEPVDCVSPTYGSQEAENSPQERPENQAVDSLLQQPIRDQNVTTTTPMVTNPPVFARQGLPDSFWEDDSDYLPRRAYIERLEGPTTENSYPCSHQDDSALVGQPWDASDKELFEIGYAEEQARQADQDAAHNHQEADDLLGFEEFNPSESPAYESAWAPGPYDSIDANGEIHSQNDFAYVSEPSGIPENTPTAIHLHLNKVDVEAIMADATTTLNMKINMLFVLDRLTLSPVQAKKDPRIKKVSSSYFRKLVPGSKSGSKEGITYKTVLDNLARLNCIARCSAYSSRHHVSKTTTLRHPRGSFYTVTPESFNGVLFSSLSAFIEKKLAKRAKVVQEHNNFKGIVFDPDCEDRLAADIQRYLTEKQDDGKLRHEDWALRLKAINQQVEDIREGRFYTRLSRSCGRLSSNVTNLPKFVRRYLSFNGSRLAEIDLVACHAHLIPRILTELAASEEENKNRKYRNAHDWTQVRHELTAYEEQLEGDFYMNMSVFLGLDTEGVSRDEFKKSFLLWFNNYHVATSKAKNRGTAEQIAFAMRSHLPHLTNFINAMRVKVGAELSNRMMRLESKIILPVARELAKREIPILTIHDAILVHPSHIDIVEKAMRKKLKSMELDKMDLSIKHPNDFPDDPPPPQATDDEIAAAIRATLGVSKVSKDTYKASETPGATKVPDECSKAILDARHDKGEASRVHDSGEHSDRGETINQTPEQMRGTSGTRQVLESSTRQDSQQDMNTRQANRQDSRDQQGSGIQTEQLETSGTRQGNEPNNPNTNEHEHSRLASTRRGLDVRHESTMPANVNKDSYNARQTTGTINSTTDTTNASTADTTTETDTFKHSQALATTNSAHHDDSHSQTNRITDTMNSRSALIATGCGSLRSAASAALAATFTKVAHSTGTHELVQLAMLELVKMDAQAFGSVCLNMIQDVHQHIQATTKPTTDTHKELNSHLDTAADKTNPTTQYRIICGENRDLGDLSTVHSIESKPATIHESLDDGCAAVHTSDSNLATSSSSVHESSLPSACVPLNFCVTLTRNGRVWRYHGTYGFQLQRSARKYTEDQFRAVVRAEYALFLANRRGVDSTKS